MEQEGSRALPQILATAGITEPVLVGHSDGGTIALVAAATVPARAVITMAAHVFCEPLSVASIAAAREDYERGELRAKLAKHHDQVEVAFWGWNRAWLDPAFATWNVERFLPAVRAPCLVMQAADDPYGTLAQVEAIARGVAGPVERRVFAEGGHAVHRSHRAAVIEAIARFLATSSPGS
jgi:pimeloyl-ACP methyl ester carboxylesterase